MGWKNSNRKTGTTFEHDLCQTLAEQGFWSHNLAQNSAGQPFDVIAARAGTSYAIDCKVCEHDVFRFNRIEENQFSAMTLWRDTGNGEGWFALRLSDGSVYMIPLSIMETLSFTKSALGEKDIREQGQALEDWLVVA